MSSKKPVYAWKFKSSSGNKIYEVLYYEGGSVSCDCPGWTRHVASDGSRSCKHTRALEIPGPVTDAISHGPLGKGHAFMTLYQSPAEDPQVADLKKFLKENHPDLVAKLDPITIPSISSFKEYKRKLLP